MKQTWYYSNSFSYFFETWEKWGNLIFCFYLFFLSSPSALKMIMWWGQATALSFAPSPCHPRSWNAWLSKSTWYHCLMTNLTRDGTSSQISEVGALFWYIDILLIFIYIHNGSCWRTPRFDWLIDGLINCLIGWLIDWLIDEWVVWLIDWLMDELIDWFCSCYT